MLVLFPSVSVNIFMSNIVAIPLTTIILYAEIILITVATFSSALATVIGKLITYLILMLNNAIHYLSTFKNITIYNVHCNAWQTLLLFAFIFLLLISFRLKKIGYAYASLLCILGFYAIQIMNYQTASKQQKLIVHNVPKANIINYINGYNYQLISLDSIKASDVKNAVEPSLIKFCSSLPKNNLAQILKCDSNYLYIQNPAFNCLVLGKNADSITNEMPCKYVILTHNSKINLAQIQAKCKPSLIIADGSNGLWKVEQWESEAKGLYLQFFSTQMQGAFVANL